MSQLITQAGGQVDNEALINFLNNTVSPSSIAKWNATNGVAAESLGASPSASATINASAINAALAKTGLVTLTTPGTYLVNGPLTINSNTSFVLGRGVTLKTSPGVNSYILRNANAVSVPFAISSLTSSDGKYATATTSTAHGLSVGSYVFVAGAQPNDYNGIWKITAVADATHFTYALSYMIGSQFSALTTPATVNTSTVGATITNVVTTTGSAIITLPVSKAGAFLVGQQVTCTGFTGTQTIVSINPDNLHITLSGNATATSSTATFAVAAGTTGAAGYYNYTSIVGMAADVNISISGGTWVQGYYSDDGSTVVGSQTKTNTHAVCLNKVRNVTVSDMFFDSCYDGFVGGSLQDAVIRNLNSANTGSTVQMMNGGRNIRISDCGGQTHDVSVSFLQGNWPFWAENNFEFLTDVEGLSINNTTALNSLYAIQLTGQAGVKFRDVKIDGVFGSCLEGQSLVTVYDDLGIGAGTTIDALEVSGVRNDRQKPYTTGLALYGTTNAASGPTINGFKLSNSDIYCPTSTESSLPYGVYLTGPNLTLGSVSVSNSRFWSSSTSGSTAISLSGNGTISCLSLRVNNVEYASVGTFVLGGFVANGVYAYDNIHINGSGFVHVVSNNVAHDIFLNNINKTGAGVANVINCGSTGSGRIKVGAVNFAASVSGGWLANPTSSWTASWTDPYINPFDLGTAASITPDVRNGTVQRHVVPTGGTAVGAPLGGGFSGYAYYPLTLVLTASAAGTDAWTFNAAFVLSANAGQAGQVLTPGAPAANKLMTLNFMFNGAKWIQTNVGSWN